MPPESADLGSPLRWIRLAEADLALAAAPLPRGAIYELLCFHAQQAAEKCIKAVLVHEGVDFPATHNIQRLVALLPDRVRGDDILVSAARLTAYAVGSRYPGTGEAVDEKEYLAALSTARKMHAWAVTYLRQAEADADRDSRRGG